jgi:Ion channel
MSELAPCKKRIGDFAKHELNLAMNWSAGKTTGDSGDSMSVALQDRRSLQLMLSLILLIVLTPFLENHRLGEFILVFLTFITLITSLLELHGKGTLHWLAFVITIPAVFVLSFGLFHPARWILVTDYALLLAFFGISSVALFSYLGQPGAITSGRIYASVSLYLMLAVFWDALYNLIESAYPGSFAETGRITLSTIPRSGFFYFSLVTLTTLGYGDIVPVSPVARIFSALEGVAGVLYIAITVARLVASYQRIEVERTEAFETDRR